VLPSEEIQSRKLVVVRLKRPFSRGMSSSVFHAPSTIMPIGLPSVGRNQLLAFSGQLFGSWYFSLSKTECICFQETAWCHSHSKIELTRF
jgi:hypothetical protein